LKITKKISRNDVEVLESQEISFDKNVHDENNYNENLSVNEINENPSANEINENKSLNNISSSRQNKIKNTNTIGEVSNENISSYSIREENSFVNKVIEEHETEITRSNKNLEMLDFIVIATRSLQYLQYLNYSFNRIKVMDNSLYHLSAVTTLDLSHNEINKIQNLDNCVNIKYLNLSHNNIQFVEGLYTLPQLEILNLSHNKIQICDVILKKLKFNKILRSLCLAGNPNYDFSTLKFKILENVESICILDDIEIFKRTKKFKAKSATISDFKLFFKSGSKPQMSEKKHNLKKIKDYIKFKKKCFIKKSNERRHREPNILWSF